MKGNFPFEKLVICLGWYGIPGHHQYDLLEALLFSFFLKGAAERVESVFSCWISARDIDTYGQDGKQLSIFRQFSIIPVRKLRLLLISLIVRSVSLFNARTRPRVHIPEPFFTR